MINFSDYFTKQDKENEIKFRVQGNFLREFGERVLKDIEKRKNNEPIDKEDWGNWMKKLDSYI